MASTHDGGEFPVARCATCARDVLCYRDLEADERDVMRCLECSAPAHPEAVRWLDLAGIEALGYGYVLPAAGCGRPDCGGGRCGRADPPA